MKLNWRFNRKSIGLALLFLGVFENGSLLLPFGLSFADSQKSAVSNSNTATVTTIPVIHIRDAIHIGTTAIITRTVKEAQEQNIPAILIELDTPGGFLEATRDIIQLMLNTENPKILVWVAPQGARAASAGAMITLAAHYAAMAPSTSIGAASPVSGDGKEINETMKAKVENDTVSFVRGIATKRGRNADWAEESVTKAASVEASKAVQIKVIDGVHSTREELWNAAQKKFPELPQSIRFEDREPLLKEKVLSFISNPNIAMGLMALGVLGIYIEMTNPGVLIPGIIGAVSLILGAISVKIIPIQPGSIVLMLVGLALFALEVLTPLPTFGVAGALGLAAILLSGVILLDPAQTNLSLDPGIWIPAFLVLAALMIWIGWSSIRILRSKNYQQGIDALIGGHGVISKLQSHNFKIKIHGELWNAKWDGATPPDASAGSEVIVTKQEGFTVFVKPLNSEISKSETSNKQTNSNEKQE